MKKNCVSKSNQIIIFVSSPILNSLEHVPSIILYLRPQFSEMSLATHAHCTHINTYTHSLIYIHIYIQARWSNVPLHKLCQNNNFYTDLVRERQKSQKKRRDALFYDWQVADGRWMLRRAFHKGRMDGRQRWGCTEKDAGDVD